MLGASEQFEVVVFVDSNESGRLGNSAARCRDAVRTMTGLIHTGFPDSFSERSQANIR